MATINVNFKWSGKIYPVAVDAGRPGRAIKDSLAALTGVPPERMKILVKGGMLKDDADVAALGLKEGQQLMMMGTAGELPKAPETQAMFVEDMSDAQITRTLKLPVGLVNLGNTCYMNATIQCLRAIPELRTALEKIETSESTDQIGNLAASVRTLLNDLSSSGSAVNPFVFLQVLRIAFPQFAERNNNGFMQQDAEECWGQIVHALNQKVPGLQTSGDVDKDKHFIDQFMNIEFIATTTCDEAPQETPSTNIETFNKLRVSIGSGVATYLVSEITASLVEKIEKNSPTLGRNAVYTKSSKITRLPQYLAINFVRFQWKAQEQVKAKILKRVKFPFELDMSPFCVPELQEKLAPAKLRLKEIADKKAEEKKLKGTVPSGADAGSSKDASKSAPKKDQQTLLKELNVDASLLSDAGVNPSGQYDLVAVLTHVGRAADSGHYIGWAKQEGENATGWWKFDDDKVSAVNEDEITKLEGGGDWHSAYICLYRAKQLE